MKELTEKSSKRKGGFSARALSIGMALLMALHLPVSAVSAEDSVEEAPLPVEAAQQAAPTSQPAPTPEPAPVAQPEVKAQEPAPTEEPEVKAQEPAAEVKAEEPAPEVKAEQPVPAAEPEAQDPAAQEPAPAAEPLRLSVTSSQAYAVAGRSALAFDVTFSGGVAPYAYSYAVSVGGRQVASSSEFSGRFTYMPAAYGVHTLTVQVTDAQGAVVSASCQTPVSMPDTVSAATWDSLVPWFSPGATFAEKLAAAAASQEGYRESAQDFILDASGESSYYSVYGDAVGDPYGDWNVSFVAYCAEKAGISGLVLPRSSSMQRLTAALFSWYEDDEASFSPQPGDLVYFRGAADANKPARVAVVKAVRSDCVQVVEGDVNGAVVSRWVALADSSIVGYTDMAGLMKAYDPNYTEPTPEPAPDPTPEPEKEAEDVEIQADGEPEAEPQGEDEGQPEAQPEAEADGDPEAQPQQEAQDEPEGQPQANGGEAEGDPEADSQGSPEQATEPEAESQAQPQPEPEMELIDGKIVKTFPLEGRASSVVVRYLPSSGIPADAVLTVKVITSGSVFSEYYDNAQAALEDGGELGDFFLLDISLVSGGVDYASTFRYEVEVVMNDALEIQPDMLRAVRFDESASVLDVNAQAGGDDGIQRISFQAGANPMSEAVLSHGSPSADRQ